MKRCPFCHESIQKRSIRCRYCLSWLVPIQPVLNAEKPNDQIQAPSTDQIQYILDKGLIRFAKFVGGLLAVFITVGAFLWGYDINKASEQAKLAKDEAQAALAKVNVTNDSVQKQGNRIRVSLKYSNELLSKIKEAAHASDSIKHYLITMGGPNSSPLLTRAPAAPRAVAKPFTVPELVKLYNLPPSLNGKGQTIAFIELGGGYKINDLEKYFRGLGIAMPKIKWVSVNGAINQPTNASSADAQVVPDIEITGAFAPAASMIVYFAPNTASGLVNALEAVITDNINHPSVLVMNWSSNEAGWTKKSIELMEVKLEAAARRNITIVIAGGGDYSATDYHVNYPASSKYVLTCGGTRLLSSGDEIVSEVVWNPSDIVSNGAGFSKIFPTPTWQASAINSLVGIKESGRAIPDVSANADPSTGYKVLIDGQEIIIGGTTAAANVWAGIIALLNQGVGHNLGYINPVLYETVGLSGACNDIAIGNVYSTAVMTDVMKVYSAKKGWDLSSGWGSPNVRKLLTAFQSKKNL